MEEVINRNWAGLCCEETCDEVESEFIQLDIGGLVFLASFCDEHAEEFENKLWESKNA